MASVVTVPFEVLSANELGARAAAAWEELPDRADARLLDAFIARFPDSKEAYLAFSLRYQLLKSLPSAAEYRRFLSLYRQRAGGDQAVYELFQLLLAENNLRGYVDFLMRFPESPLARMAELRVHALSFEVVQDLATLPDVNAVEEYEAFLEAFPRAVQVPVVTQLATRRALADAKKELVANQDSLPFAEFEAWKQEQGISLFVQWVEEFKSFAKRWDLPESPPGNGEELDPLLVESLLTEAADRADDDAGAKLLSQHRLDRLEEVLTQVFSGTNGAAQYAAATLIQLYLGKIIEKLGDIDATLKSNHAELVNLLREEFKETRQVVRDGFRSMEKALEKLDATIENLTQVVADGFQLVAGKLDEMRVELKNVHETLEDINWNLNEINAGIAETNQSLATLNQHVSSVSQQIQTLNTNVSSGFAFVGQQLIGLREDVVRGFDNIPEGDAFSGFVNGLQGGYARLESHVGKEAVRFRQKTQQAGKRIGVVSKGTSKLGKTLKF